MQHQIIKNLTREVNASGFSVIIYLYSSSTGVNLDATYNDVLFILNEANEFKSFKDFFFHAATVMIETHVLFTFGELVRIVVQRTFLSHNRSYFDLCDLLYNQLVNKHVHIAVTTLRTY
jgi:hypothetical protein